MQRRTSRLITTSYDNLTLADRKAERLVSPNLFYIFMLSGHVYTRCCISHSRSFLQLNPSVGRQAFGVQGLNSRLRPVIDRCTCGALLSSLCAMEGAVALSLCRRRYTHGMVGIAAYVVFGLLFAAVSLQHNISFMRGRGGGENVAIVG